MTENELEKLRLICRAEAAEIMLGALVAATVKKQPAAAQLFQQTGSLMKKSYSNIYIRDIPPEYSDLYAGEFQDAVDSLVVRLQAGTLGK
jgi:hypothetical protein